MSPFNKIILITIVMGITVTIFYALVVRFYYWGERGKPPPGKAAKRRSKK